MLEPLHESSGIAARHRPALCGQIQMSTQLNGLRDALRWQLAKSVRGLVNRTGPFWVGLAGLDHWANPDDLLEEAVRRTGLVDFGEPSVEVPLRTLSETIVDEAQLSHLGRLSFHWDTFRLLVNRLWITETLKRDPSIEQEGLSAPVFITGLPRTASTFLQTLFLQDPANRSPQVWEVTYPRPGRGYPPDFRILKRKVRRELAWFDFLEPEFQSVYPTTWNSPQECSEILSHSFESYRFDGTYEIPSYLRWMDQRDPEPAYALHRRFLQLLQHRGRSGRWVLKAPDHVFTLDGLLRTYPDARIIVTHRDPASVLPSVVALTALLHGLFSDNIGLEQIRHKVTDRWVEGANRIIAFSEASASREGRVTHVFYDELTRDPVGIMERLYGFLGWPWSEEQYMDFRKYLTNSQAGRYRPNRFQKPLVKSMPPALIREQFARYLATYRIHSET